MQAKGAAGLSSSNKSSPKNQLLIGSPEERAALSLHPDNSNSIDQDPSCTQQKVIQTQDSQPKIQNNQEHSFFSSDQLSQLTDADFKQPCYSLNERKTRWVKFSDRKQPQDSDKKSHAAQSVNLLVITWNQGGTLPTDSIEHFIQQEAITQNDKNSADFIVVAAQESCRSILASFFYENKSEWEENLQKVFGINYEMQASQSMNALHLCLFARKDELRRLSCIEMNSLRTGLLNMVGNKGAIGLSLEIDGSSFLFVNFHLESGQNQVNERNAMLKLIQERLELPSREKKLVAVDQPLFDRFDFVFLLGDFNYRIDGLNEFQIQQKMSLRDLKSLYENDQLYKLRQSEQGKVLLKSFKEGLPQFMPTYRMSRGKNHYSEGRTPAWTDRILFKAREQNMIQLLNYEGNFQVFGSDHRPVFAQFQAKTVPNLVTKPFYTTRDTKCCEQCNIF